MADYEQAVRLDPSFGQAYANRGFGYSRAMVRLVSRLATVRGANVELVWG